MKITTTLLLLFLIPHLHAQAPLQSEKYNVLLDSSIFNATSADQFEQLLNEEIASIQFVSLLPKLIGDSIRDSTGNWVQGKRYRFQSIFEDSTVNLQLIKNRKTIHHHDVKKLMTILYTYKESMILGACYQPRHGIRFLDRYGKDLCFIEVCFECDNLQATKSAHLKGLDSDQYIRLQQMFTKYMGDYLFVYDTRR